MNTIMEEKIKQAFQEWKEQPKEQLKEIQMVNKVPTQNGILTNALLDKIQAQPGISGKALRQHIQQVLPNTPLPYVPAVLKHQTDKGVLVRKEMPHDGGLGRTSFAYMFVPEGRRVPILIPPKYSKKPKAKAVEKESKGITTLVPTPPTTPTPAPAPAQRIVTNPLNVGPTTLHITISTEQGSYSMKLDEAKFIYQQLNQIFGSAR
jgi:hypothetical protein